MIISLAIAHPHAAVLCDVAVHVEQLPLRLAAELRLVPARKGGDRKVGVNVWRAPLWCASIAEGGRQKYKYR